MGQCQAEEAGGKGAPQQRNWQKDISEKNDNEEKVKNTIPEI